MASFEIILTAWLDCDEQIAPQKHLLFQQSPARDSRPATPA
jgi:hypothetical protein